MKRHDDFLNPIFSARTIAYFQLRRSVLNALTAELSSFHGTVLDIGCGRKPYQPILLSPPSRAVRYLSLDLKVTLRHPAYAYIEYPDIEWDGRTIPLDGNSVEC